VEVVLVVEVLLVLVKTMDVVFDVLPNSDPAKRLTGAWDVLVALVALATSFVVEVVVVVVEVVVVLVIVLVVDEFEKFEALTSSTLNSSETSGFDDGASCSIHVTVQL